jgi:NAD(P)-dependent dehydrogenase (short-subunit alcohol dehydrogenase family)
MSCPTNPYADAHLSPNGAGDSRPTALQVIHDEGLVNKLTGKVMLVTGASSGIGIDTVAALHATGADVYMQARDMKKGREVMEKILASSEGTGEIALIEMELGSFESIRTGVADFLRTSNKLNVLINNAGKLCIVLPSRDIAVYIRH